MHDTMSIYMIMILCLFHLTSVLCDSNMMEQFLERVPPILKKCGAFKCDSIKEYCHEVSEGDTRCGLCSQICGHRRETCQDLCPLYDYRQSMLRQFEESSLIIVDGSGSTSEPMPTDLVSPVCPDSWPHIYTFVAVHIVAAVIIGSLFFIIRKLQKRDRDKWSNAGSDPSMVSCAAQGCLPSIGRRNVPTPNEEGPAGLTSHGGNSAGLPGDGNDPAGLQDLGRDPTGDPGGEGDPAGVSSRGGNLARPQGQENNPVGLQGNGRNSAELTVSEGNPGGDALIPAPLQNSTPISNLRHNEVSLTDTRGSSLVPISSSSQATPGGSTHQATPVGYKFMHSGSSDREQRRPLLGGSSVENSPSTEIPPTPISHQTSPRAWSPSPDVGTSPTGTSNSAAVTNTASPTSTSNSAAVTNAACSTTTTCTSQPIASRTPSKPVSHSRPRASIECSSGAESVVYSLRINDDCVRNVQPTSAVSVLQPPIQENGPPGTNLLHTPRRTGLPGGSQACYSSNQGHPGNQGHIHDEDRIGNQGYSKHATDVTSVKHC